MYRFISVCILLRVINSAKKKSYCSKFLDKKDTSKIIIFFNYLTKIYLTTLLAIQTVVKNLPYVNEVDHDSTLC